MVVHARPKTPKEKPKELDARLRILRQKGVKFHRSTRVWNGSSRGAGVPSTSRPVPCLLPSWVWQGSADRVDDALIWDAAVDREPYFFAHFREFRQICMSTERVIVGREVSDPLCKACQAAVAGALPVGDPRKATSFESFGGEIDRRSASSNWSAMGAGGQGRVQRGCSAL